MTCSVAECARPVRCRGFCGKHYTRWRKFGDPSVVLPPNARRVYKRTPAIERFMSKVNKTETCWLWTGFLDHHGYARFNDGDRTRHAHRWAYQHFVGPIPDGLHIDHLCRTPACVRPDHLEPVTQRENNLRSYDARFGLDKCTRGHEFTEANTYWRPDGHGRQCRICNQRRAQEKKARRAA